MHPLVVRTGLLLALLLSTASVEAHALDDLIRCVKEGPFCG